MDQVQAVSLSSSSPTETLKSMIRLADEIESKLKPDFRGFMFQVRRELSNILDKETRAK